MSYAAFFCTQGDSARSERYRGIPFNRVAVDWFVRSVLPLILAEEAGAKLVIVGSDPPPEYTYADHADHMQMLGYVEDIREPLARYAIFVCPILSGSGVRVKLLEAYAAGIQIGRASCRERV